MHLLFGGWALCLRCLRVVYFYIWPFWVTFCYHGANWIICCPGCECANCPLSLSRNGTTVWSSPSYNSYLTDYVFLSSLSFLYRCLFPFPRASLFFLSHISYLVLFPLLCPRFDHICPANLVLYGLLSCIRLQSALCAWHHGPCLDRGLEWA